MFSKEDDLDFYWLRTKFKFILRLYSWIEIYDSEMIINTESRIRELSSSFCWVRLYSFLTIDIRKSINPVPTSVMCRIVKLVRQIDFDSMSTCLGLFYAKKLGNCIHCTFLFTFLRRCFLSVILFIYFLLHTVLSNSNILCRFIWSIKWGG